MLLRWIRALISRARRARFERQRSGLCAQRVGVHNGWDHDILSRAYQEHRRLSELLGPKRPRYSHTLCELVMVEAFRRAPELGMAHQVVIGPLTVDFASHRHRIVVEVDGPVHRKDPMVRERDVRRDAYLARKGFQVLRFTDDDVFRSPWRVVEEVRRHAAKSLG